MLNSDSFVSWVETLNADQLRLANRILEQHLFPNIGQELPCRGIEKTIEKNVCIQLSIWESKESYMTIADNLQKQLMNAIETSDNVYYDSSDQYEVEIEEN